MKKTIYIIFCIIIIISCVSILFIFRSIPKQQIWKDYILLLVPTTINSEKIIDILETSKITDYIYKNSENYVIQSMYSAIQYDQSNHDYESLFYDSSYSYDIYYIPNRYTNLVTSIVKKNDQIDFILDTNVSYPLLPLCFSVFIFVILFILSKKKFFYTQITLPFCFYVFCFPSYYSLISFVIIGFAVFIWQKIHQRKDEILILFKRTPFLVLLCFAFIVQISNNPFQSLFLLVTYVFSFCSYILSSLLLSIKKQKDSFEPSLIISAKFINTFDKKAKLSFIPIACVFLLSLIFQVFLPNNISSSNLLVPSPVDYTENHDFSVNSYSECLTTQTESTNIVYLPNLINYLNKCWQVLTYPYKSLNKENIESTVLPEEKIVIYDYIEKSGKLVENENTVYCFNNQFINDSLELLNQSNKIFIENLFINQDFFCSVIYKKIGKTNSTSTKIILFLLISFILSLLMSLYAIINTRKNKEQDFYVTCK